VRGLREVAADDEVDKVDVSERRVFPDEPLLEAIEQCVDEADALALDGEERVLADLCELADDPGRAGLDVLGQGVLRDEVHGVVIAEHFVCESLQFFLSSHDESPVAWLWFECVHNIENTDTLYALKHRYILPPAHI